MTIRSGNHNLINTFASVLAIVLLLSTAAFSAEQPPEKYGPAHIAGGVKGTPGTVAWSPDGKRIAYIAEDVRIYDAESGTESPVDIEGAYFLSWSDSDRLVALYGDGKLALIDPEASEFEPLTPPPHAVAVYPLWGDERLLVLTARSEKISIGIEVSYGIHTLDPDDGKVSEVYSTSRILPLKASEVSTPNGWMSDGPSPVSDETMLIEFIVPPNASQYSRVLVVDSFVRADREAVARHTGDLFNLWGSWSPLGGRTALSDTKGRLRVVSLKGDISEVDDEVNGLYPEWDPQGGRIFFGGYLIEEDGSGREPILPGVAESAAFFSPDGGRMVLSANGELWLLRDMERSKSAPVADLMEARKKASLLRELLTDGLITGEEYRSRLSGIIEPQVDEE